MQPLSDIAPLPERTQALFRVSGQNPARGAGWFRWACIRIIGEHGTPLFRSRELPADNSTLSDRAYFIAHRDHPNLGVVVSDPLITQIEHRPAVIMARRLEKRDGSFDGIVQAVVDLEDFQRLYQALDLGEGSAMNLLRDDGTLFVRQPQSPQAVGAKFPELVATASKSARLVR